MGFFESNFTKIVGFARHVLLIFLSKRKKPFFNRLYWELRVVDIYAKWGDGRGDYELLGNIISDIRPKTLLDIGCGSGRLFPVFRELKVPEVVAQDIARSAIKMCKKGFPDMNCRYEIGDIRELSYSDGYFDLIVSNRVLSAVMPESIGQVLAILARLGKNIYINELSASDDTGKPSAYWFRHDYDVFQRMYGFTEAKKGTQGKQTWVLYSRQTSAS